MLNTPFIHSEKNQNSFVAFWAIEIKPRTEKGANPFIGMSVAQQTLEYTRQIKACLQKIHRSSLVSSISLRYICLPHELEIITILMLRVDGESSFIVEQKAQKAWNEFLLIFPTDFYQIQPIVDSQTFMKVYIPIDINAAKIYEIRKNEDVLSSKYVMAGEYFYSVMPLQTEYTPLKNFMLHLVKHNNSPLIINICLSPTQLYDYELEILQNIIGQLRRFASGFTLPLLGANYIYDPDPNAELCLRRYLHLFSDIENFFQYRIQIISTKKIPSDELNPIASSLNRDRHIVYASNENLSKAQWTYRNLDPYPIWGGISLWNDENAPHSLRRISYLVSLEEAFLAFRLPIHFQENLPITTNEIKISGNVSESTIIIGKENEVWTEQKQDRTAEKDRITFNKTLEILPSHTGAIFFLRTHNFGSSFDPIDDLKELRNFRHYCSRPEFFYLDDELENLRLDLLESFNKLDDQIYAETREMPNSRSGTYRIRRPEDYSDVSPEKFEAVKDDLNQRARLVCQKYDQLIKTGHRKT